MSLLISILKAPSSIVVKESSKTFDSSGGSIGRGSDNTWILDDPERYLSGTHCLISFENGEYWLTDQSTNGTFYNGSADPIGKGSRLPLKDRDTFSVGDYEFSVQLQGGDESSVSSPFGSSPFASDFDSVSSHASDSPFADSPFASGHVSSSESLFGNESVETDPLVALDKARGGHDTKDAAASAPLSDPFATPSFSDQADALNQQISWPDAKPENDMPANNAIPDDWDDLIAPSSEAGSKPGLQSDFDASRPLTEPPQVPRPAVPAIPDAGVSAQQLAQLEQKNAQLEAEVKSLKQQVKSQSTALNANSTVDTTLIDALGFHQKNLDDVEIMRINKLAGEVLREMVSGLMQVLGSRSAIKNEFRMNVTTIQPVENNPLKFSANINDALENMFLKQGNTFKKPVEAVQDGFEGVAEHQVAILAGIREAFKSVIDRFDPQKLEERFTRHSKGGLMLGSQKAKNWESYVDYYDELVGDIDKSFQYLYGDGFVRAYEEQLQKLAISRKTRKYNQEH